MIFVGRVTRQKGLPVLLRAAASLDPAAQLVVCAGQADTPELEAEVSELAAQLRASRSGVVWISGMLAKREVIQLLTHATVFACPSLYEPLGIVNLEAMACGTAVVGSRVGGIPEVVADGKTGLLVPPGDPAALAGAINALVADAPRAAEMGRLGRERAVGRVRLGQRSPRRRAPCTPSSPERLTAPADAGGARPVTAGTGARPLRRRY